ncbi:hypothetical protein RZR97_06335 [Hydrogenimonas thermophila]|uniref:hypothetical protein n=1 Tax=Hydrogenimonas thermophila TaxID=223786 RepID=UPI0029372FC9|nr:hypothetical protein [Hydrogenimonas thermophila]WOE68736.1 hypothetical protein RZR91_06355 [Hydrogenimonas thermophila]WOE71246.1 hypothetical protein RZR97_06335 [Hydrogenimonas thermophila]
MIRYLLFLTLMLGISFATEPSVYSAYLDSEFSEENITTQINEEINVSTSIKEPDEQLIYLNIENMPEKIYVGQVFTLTLKVTSLEKNQPYTIDLENEYNLTIMQEPNEIAPKAINYLTYVFKATSSQAKLPDFVVYYDNMPEKEYRLNGSYLKTVSLNPPKDFCGVLAKNMQLVNYQASTYTEDTNLLALQLNISYGNYDDFHLPNSNNQGIDTYSGDLNSTTLLYFAVYPLNVEKVEFTYFNLSKNRYEKFNIPIIVKRSSVSTQSNLDPQASEFTKFKIIATIFLITIWLILWLMHRGWMYPILIILAVAYLLTYLIPLKTICIKPGSTLYLLPTKQSTPVMNIYEEVEAKEMNRYGNYVKIQLQNNTIGWIKNESICTH